MANFVVSVTGVVSGVVNVTGAKTPIEARSFVEDLIEDEELGLVHWQSLTEIDGADVVIMSVESAEEENEASST